MLRTATVPPDPEWDRILPHLDAALAHLSPIERAAVIAHCLNDQPIAQFAATLDLTEPAARMRVQPAIRRLRSLLEPQNSTALAQPLRLVPTYWARNLDREGRNRVLRVQIPLSVKYWVSA